MLDQLTSTDLAAHVHEMFRIQLEGVQPIDLELNAVTDLNPATAVGPEGRRPFSIEFLGPISSQYLLQHIYRLEHAQLGVLEIFLVPLGPQQGRMRYEAIFT
ncbi:hypothetical protein TFLX_02044 [Thermoflexales bacterium]|nr:hypothetical protein TFLX_02044 [Thermoflexales bacterium]